MPREEIDLSCKVEYLSVLDEDGQLDEALAPDVSDEQLEQMHRVMLLARRFDERMLNLQRQGRIGTFAPVSGQEAAQVGVMAALQAQDWFVPSFREFAASIWRGTPLKALLLYNAGYNEGAAIAEDAHDLPIAIPVATQIPHAVGLAYAARYRDTDAVALVFFGDGATSEGDFHEAMNFASVFATPTLFVCQNNQWAISIPREDQTHSKTLAQKALAYGMPGLQVDGNDLLAVLAAAREAVERARSGGGPTLIECVTYRLSVHTTADDPSRYRSDEEVEDWERREPLRRLQRHLKERGILDDDRIEALEQEIGVEIDQAWQETEQAMQELDEPLDIFAHNYAELPRTLREQREEMASRLGEGGGRAE
ncbi:pyruvate dehydrogenase (acetyl-transferring) E1 component subunit alpha [Lamprobacter modestohalophilus]|uniref:pyruvate dehydrogenase (acetyl-transferring) E1 component subunit alpha n=1 Tax=Lamprobacter modestohalophilus TaxID=1064514 RepID=UPI002ADEFBF8|nr:pyruvate dehydrogenase (acetyl-transferring) E1 component subunit alpha [Lamprobacter modestohalophilus]MEA1052195.1 pyruvate dehydrogenase (acetyl-transferring) E1 component subunit alpha [Lamprobacter modestohalophilus]